MAWLLTLDHESEMWVVEETSLGNFAAGLLLTAALGPKRTSVRYLVLIPRGVHNVVISSRTVRCESCPPTSTRIPRKIRMCLAGVSSTAILQASYGRRVMQILQDRFSGF